MPKRKKIRKPPTRRKDDPSLVIACVLVLLVAAVYGYSTGFDFVHYDDNAYVTDNTYVRNGLTWEGIQWAFTTTYANFWHPLTWLSLMLDQQLLGPGPFGHHFVSLILHAINALILFGALRAMTGDHWKSAMVSALLAVHPLHVESVVWIAQRKDMLSGLFWMLTLWAYARYVKRPGAAAYLAVLAAYVLGLMAKPMGVTLPFALLILDYWPLKRQLPFRRLVFEKAPLFLISAIASAVAFWAQKSGGAVVSVEALSLQTRVLNALTAYVTYLWKAIWPFDLAVFYPLPQHVSPWLGLGAGGFLLAVTIGVVWTRKTRPYLPAGWFWFLGTLVPVIGLVKVGDFTMADRYAYIPLIGIYIMFVWGGQELLSKWIPAKRLRVAIPAILFLLLAWRAYDQTTHWKDGIALFEHALKVTRANYVAHNNLGVLFLRQGDFDKAEKHLHQVLSIKADSDEALHNLGTILTRKGQPAKAAEYYYRALAIHPQNSDAHYNLGGFYKGVRQYTEAVSHFRKVVKIVPHDWQAHYHLAECLMQQGNIREALASLETTIRLNPDHPAAREDLEKAHILMVKLEKEIGTLKSKEDDQPDDVERYLKLGYLSIVVGRPEESILYYERALTLAPDHPEGLDGLAWAYVQAKQYEQALTVLKKLSQRNPSQAVIDYNIASVYGRAQHPEESMQWLKKAIEKGYDNWSRVRSDEDLDLIRATPEFRSMMQTSMPRTDPEGS